MTEHQAKPKTRPSVRKTGSEAVAPTITPLDGGDGNGAAAPGQIPASDATRATADCTIVIPVHNKASLTRQCLNALLAQRSERVEREIVVVNDGSTDLTEQLLTAYAGRIRAASHPTARGFAHACNAGAALATGRYLVLLNNDTLPRPGWLRALVSYAEAHPAAAVVGAKLLYPNDTVQHAGVVFGLDRYPHHLYAGFPADHPATNVSRRFRAVTAACCLVRREVFESLGGFDTAFVNGWEDVDLCLRLGEAGHEVHYCHESVVYHLESASRGLRAPRERENRGLFEARWRDRVVPDDLGYYAADGLLTVDYAARYPIRLGVSPLLAGIDVGDDERLADRLLQERARQVAILLRNNLVMNVRVQEAELKVQAAELRAREAEAGNAAAATAVPADGAAVRSLADTGQPKPAHHPIIGSCERPGREPEVVAEDFLVVSGWALSRAGILRVETYVDGHRRGEIAYGDWLRPDVAALHPGYPDGENCGFVGKIPTEGLGDGQHDILIRVVAEDGKQADLRTHFEVDSTAKSTGRILAAFDRPKPNARTVVRDRLSVAGWALAPSGIRSIETFVDGERLGSVSHGALRPDVGMAHPDYPEPDHSGFTGSVSVGHLEDGEHALLVRITANDDRELELKARFEVDTAAEAIGDVPHVNAQFSAWLRAHSPDMEELNGAREAASALAKRPRIAFLVPIGDEPVSVILDVIDSVRNQVYDEWEVCLAPDVLTDHAARHLLAEVAASDPRIKLLTERRGTGFVHGANEALALAEGEFIAVLGRDDVLAPTALLEVARLLEAEPELDVVYGDQDKVDDEAGVRWDPFFKPEWSPDLLLSSDYLGPVTFYRRTLVEEIGGFRRGFAGAERYDVALRATERARRVGHVPQLLVSHRAPAGTTDAETIGADETATAAAAKALTEALERRALPGTVEPGIVPGRWRVRYKLTEWPGVTLLMPTGGKLQFLKPCLESILGTSTYPNLEIVLIDNSPSDGVAELCREVTAAHPDLRLHREPFSLTPFNFSAIVNHGAPFVETPYLVMLNDDVTVITPDWIEAMLEHAQRPEVGVVGAKLLYPDDTIQHAGVLLGPYQGTGHAFKGFAGDHTGYFGLPNVVRNYSAVTFACAMMRKAVFDEVGGLDADNLPIAFNDVDMCLRIGERGYRVVYTPHAALYHHESVTKKVIAAPTEIGHLRNRWGHLIDRDPFYNPNLTRRGEDLSLNME